MGFQHLCLLELINNQPSQRQRRTNSPQAVCSSLWQVGGDKNHPRLFSHSAGQLSLDRLLPCLFQHLGKEQHCFRNSVSGQMSVAVV